MHSYLLAAESQRFSFAKNFSPSRCQTWSISNSGVLALTSLPSMSPPWQSRHQPRHGPLQNSNWVPCTESSPNRTKQSERGAPWRPCAAVTYCYRPGTLLPASIDECSSRPIVRITGLKYYNMAQLLPVHGITVHSNSYGAQSLPLARTRARAQPRSLAHGGCPQSSAPWRLGPGQVPRHWTHPETATAALQS